MVDGAVNGSGLGGAAVRQGCCGYLQTGRVQFYALFMFGMMVMFGLYKIDRNTYRPPLADALTVIFVVAVLAMAIFTAHYRREHRTGRMRQDRYVTLKDRC